MKNNKFSRILLSLTAILLVMVFTGSALAAGYVQATGGDVYVRNAPNRSGGGLDAMQEGQTATYLGSSAIDERGVIWYYVNFKGTDGWVSSRYSKLYGASVTVPSTGVTSGTVKAVNGDTYLRTAPNLNGGGIDAMQKGETATYLGSSSIDGRGVVWYYVNFKGKTGWVSSRYTELYGSSTSVPSTPTYYGTAQAVGGNCNIRNAPNLNGNEIGMMKKGQTATYLGSSSVDERGVTWYKVNFNGKIGWVSSRYTNIY